MTIFSGILVFVLIWWMVLFCVLPFGVPDQYQEDREVHIAPGSPPIANIAKKMLVTTAISLILWVVVFLIIRSDVISFQRMAGDL